MAIVMNLTYTGENGSALAFVREMEESGTAPASTSSRHNAMKCGAQPVWRDAQPVSCSASRKAWRRKG